MERGYGIFVHDLMQLNYFHIGQAFDIDCFFLQVFFAQHLPLFPILWQVDEPIGMDFSTSDIYCCVISVDDYLSHLLVDCDYSLYPLHSKDMASLASIAVIV